jgi:hypothetical protein
MLDPKSLGVLPCRGGVLLSHRGACENGERRLTASGVGTEQKVRKCPVFRSNPLDKLGHQN